MNDINQNIENYCLNNTYLYLEKEENNEISIEFIKYNKDERFNLYESVENINDNLDYKYEYLNYKRYFI